jgi:hypothetical protein
MPNSKASARNNIPFGTEEEEEEEEEGENVVDVENEAEPIMDEAIMDLPPRVALLLVEPCVVMSPWMVVVLSRRRKKRQQCCSWNPVIWLDCLSCFLKMDTCGFAVTVTGFVWSCVVVVVVVVVVLVWHSTWGGQCFCGTITKSTTGRWSLVETTVR